MRRDGATRREDGRAGAITGIAEGVEAGALAGMLGGVAMLVLLCAWAIATGRDVLAPLQWFGGLFYRDQAAAAGFSSALWGLAIHLAVASALGVPFALLVRVDVDPMIATAGGVVYGLFAWVLLTFLVLPVVDPFMARAVAQAPIVWFAAHVPYGGSLSLGLQVRRALAARERRFQEA